MNKHFTPLFKHFNFRLIIFSAFLLMSIYACKREILSPKENFNVNATQLSEVKQWFNNHDNFALLEAPANWLRKTDAIWDKAYGVTNLKQTG